MRKSEMKIHAQPVRPSRAGRVGRFRRGAAMVEYGFLLGVFAVPVILGIIAGGVKMMRGYDTGIRAIVSPRH